MRSFALCGAAARGQAAAPAGIAASAAGPAPRPRIARRRCLLVAAAAEAGSDAPAAELQSFATTAPLRVRGMDGKLSEVRVDDAWRGLAAGSRRLVAAPACRLHLAALLKEQTAAAAAVHAGRCMHAGCHACEARPRWHVPALRSDADSRCHEPAPACVQMPGTAGVYAVYDSTGTLQYVGISRKVGRQAGRGRPALRPLPRGPAQGSACAWPQALMQSQCGRWGGGDCARAQRTQRRHFVSASGCRPLRPRLGRRARAGQLRARALAVAADPADRDQRGHTCRGAGRADRALGQGACRVVSQGRSPTASLATMWRLERGSMFGRCVQRRCRNRAELARCCVLPAGTRPATAVQAPALRELRRCLDRQSGGAPLPPPGRLTCNRARCARCQPPAGVGAARGWEGGPAGGVEAVGAGGG